MLQNDIKYIPRAFCIMLHVGRDDVESGSRVHTKVFILLYYRLAPINNENSSSSSFVMQQGYIKIKLHN